MEAGVVWSWNPSQGSRFGRRLLFLLVYYVVGFPVTAPWTVRKCVCCNGKTWESELCSSFSAHLSMGIRPLLRLVQHMLYALRQHASPEMFLSLNCSPWNASHDHNISLMFLFQCPIQRTAIRPDLDAAQWYLCPWMAQVMGLLLPLPPVPLLPAFQVLTRDTVPQERLQQPWQTPVTDPARLIGR